MYIHIGAGKNVRAGSVLGWFDMDGRWDSETTLNFLQRAEREKKTAAAGQDLPRSFVLTDDGVIFTHISTAALSNRADRGSQTDRAQEEN